MRMFVVLLAVVFASSLSFFASADNSRGFAFHKQAEQEASNLHCARKVSIGAETACLMQKRKGRA